MNISSPSSRPMILSKLSFSTAPPRPAEVSDTETTGGHNDGGGDAKMEVSWTMVASLPAASSSVASSSIDNTAAADAIPAEEDAAKGMSKETFKDMHELHTSTYEAPFPNANGHVKEALKRKEDTNHGSCSSDRLVVEVVADPDCIAKLRVHNGEKMIPHVRYGRAPEGHNSSRRWNGRIFADRSFKPGEPVMFCLLEGTVTMSDDDWFKKAEQERRGRLAILKDPSQAGRCAVLGNESNSSSDNLNFLFHVFVCGFGFFNFLA